MYGPEFLWHGKDGFERCGCDAPQCRRAGYFPTQGALEVTASMREEVLDTEGRIFTEETRQKYIDNPNRRLYLYPWHFYPRDLRSVGDKIWEFDFDKDAPKKYTDDENVTHDFPPPIYNVDEFISQHLITRVRPQDRWAQEYSESKMPTWMLNMLEIDDRLSTDESPRKKQKTKDLSDVNTLKRNGEKQRARCKVLSQRVEDEKRKGEEKDNNLSAAKEQHKQEIAELKEKHEKVMNQLKDTFKTEIETLKREYDNRSEALKREYDNRLEEKDAIIDEQKETIRQLEEEFEKLDVEYNKVSEELLEYRKGKAQPLRYDDLGEGRILAEIVSKCTFLETKEENDLFLEILDYADGTEGSYAVGDGLCENWRKYCDISFDERSGEKEPPVMQMDSPDYKRYIERVKAGRAGRSDRDWKDDYLAYCIYIKSGATQAFVAALCGIGPTKMSNIVYGWTQFLDDALQRWFPTPTRSQLLRAYPQRFRDADGHTKCFMILDACEFFAQSSSNPNVSSTTFSDYKGKETIKALGSCGPIGEVAGKFVPDAKGGRASDVMMTDYTNSVLCMC